MAMAKDVARQPGGVVASAGRPVAAVPVVEVGAKGVDVNRVHVVDGAERGRDEGIIASAPRKRRTRRKTRALQQRAEGVDVPMKQHPDGGGAAEPDGGAVHSG